MALACAVSELCICRMPGGTDIIIDMERTLRDKEVQVAHLMACVYDEQNRTQVPTAPTNQPWDPVQLMRLGGAWPSW